MCSAAHSECVGQFVGRTSRSAPSRVSTRPASGKLRRSRCACRPARPRRRGRRTGGRRGRRTGRRPRNGRWTLRYDPTRPVGPDQGAGVEESIAVAFEQAEDGVDAPSSAQAAATFADARPGDRLGELQSPRPCSRSRSRSGRTRGRRRASPRAAAASRSLPRIAWRLRADLAELRLHLHGRHAERLAHRLVLLLSYLFHLCQNTRITAGRISVTLG